jgi:RNA polymerase sigma factor (sigma-70 family)
MTVDQSDGQLLERFADEHDQTAFTTLMQRHGPLVLSVCRRILTDAQDVEDAFQATFVVLVRRASGLRKEGSLASWLYGVAYRVALKSRSSAVRRKQREQQADAMAQTEVPQDSYPEPEPDRQASWRELRGVLDDEVNRLPEKYRAPLVLCYLEGKTNEQAAQELGWPIGSMSCRLAKARDLLRDRLTGRGVALSASALTVGLGSQAANAAVPVNLADATLNSAMLLAAGKAASGVVSAQVAMLADGVLHSMMAARLKFTLAVCLSLVLVGSGGALAYRSFASEKPAPTDAAFPTDEQLVQMVEERVAQWQPTTAERRMDEIGWAKDLLDARRLAQQHNRPIFAFTHSGHMNTGRSGGSAFGMRARSLNDDRVIALLNRYFVPVYSCNEDRRDGTASAEEKAEGDRIYHTTIEAKMDSGTDCVYILTPDGKIFDSIRMRTASYANPLVERLEQIVQKLGLTAGTAVAPIKSQMPPPPAEPGSVVLHLAARVFGRTAWCEFPAEEWHVLTAEDQAQLVSVPSFSVGASWDIPEELTRRLVPRFYPQTENNDLAKSLVERQVLRGTILTDRDGIVRARLEGSLRMKHNFYPDREDDRIVDATMVGFVDFDAASRRIRSLRLVTDEATYGEWKFGVALWSLP